MKAGIFVLKGLAVAVLTACLCSCGGSDDNTGSNGDGSGSEGGGGNGGSIVGDWTLISTTAGGQTQTAQQLGLNVVVHFVGDGTYSTVERGAGGTTTENGTWFTVGNVLTAVAAGEQPEVATYSVSGNTLTINVTQGGTPRVDVYDRNGTSSIVGSWNLLNMTGGGDTLTPSDFGMSVVVHFNADGSYSDVETGADGITETDSGTWSVNGNQLTINELGEEPWVATYSVNGNTLTIEGLMTFSVTSGGESEVVDNVMVVETFTRL